jgi:hypothetical protein
VLVALHRPDSTYVEFVVVKLKHIGTRLFKELIADPTRYNDADPFDDTGDVWIENCNSQDLRRALVSIFERDKTRHDGSFFVFEREYAMVINMRAPLPPLSDMDTSNSSSEEEEEEEEEEEKKTTPK